MNEDDYYDMNPSHFAAKIDGYNNKLFREGNATRQLAFFSLMPWMKKGTTYAAFCESWQLPGDKQNDEKKGIEPKIASHEKFNEIMQMANKRMSEVRRKKAEKEIKEKQEREGKFKQRFENQNN